MWRKILISFGLVFVGACVLLGALAFQHHQHVMAQVEGDDYVRIRVDGRWRSFYVHLPENAPTEPLPVLIAMHGGGGTAPAFATYTGLSPDADAAGYILVYPNGNGRLGERLLTWNAGNCCAYAYEQGFDDVAFIAAMIDYVNENYNSDPSRVYLTGHSNGAMMSYKAACELDIESPIAGIAPVGGAMNLEICTPQAPMSVLIIHGTNDDHVRYEGGAPLVSVDPNPRVDQPVSYARDFWVDFNQCNAAPTIIESEFVRREVYTGCANGVRVEVATLIGGEHAWPGGIAPTVISDEPFPHYDASFEILDFFSALAS